MDVFSSRGSCVGLGLESSYGTGVSRTRWAHINESSLTQAARNISPRGRLAHTSAGFEESHFVVDEQVGGALTLPASYSGLGLIFRAALGTVSGTGPFSFAAAATIPSLTIEQIVGSSTKSELYTGCKVNTFTVNVSPGSEVTFVADFIAKAKAAAGSAGSPSLPSAVPLEHYECVITWGGSSIGKVKTYSSVIANNLSRRPVVGQLGTAEPSLGLRSVRTTVVIDKDSFDARAAEIADTADDLVLTCTDTATGTKTLVYTIPNCRAKVTETIGGAIADLTTSIEFVGGGNPTLVLTNGEATYDV